MSDDTKDAVAAAKAKALEIASRLSSSVLGKHPRDDAQKWPVSDGSAHAVGRGGGGGGGGERLRKKIYVPVRDNPDFNYLGLLIGPRGSTQQQMEADSGARILIRGRGSSKDGNDEDPDDDLHVVIVGDTEDSVQRASRMVSDLLFNREEQAAIKNKQLRRVAEMNSGGQGQGDTRNLVLSSSLYAGDVDYPPFRGTGDTCRSVKVPAERVGQIIGRGGDTIKMLQARTGAYIQVSRENDNDPNFKTITIEGNDEQVRRGQEEIQRIIDDCDQRDRDRSQAGPGPMGGAGVGYSGSGGAEIMKIPSDTVGLLIGKGGQTIRQMQLRTGCSIQVQRDSDADPHSHVRDVTLAGTPEQVQLGRSEIERLVEAQATGQKAVPVDVPGMVTRVITVPNSMVGIVIGRGGETIKGIQARTGARVQVSKDATAPEREITLSGNDQAVGYAQHEIDQLVAPENQRPGGSSYGDSYGAGAYGAYGAQYGYQQYGYGQQAQDYGWAQQHQQQQQQQQPVRRADDGTQRTDAAAGAEQAQGAPTDQASYEYQYQQYLQQYYAYYGQYPPEAYAQQQQQPAQQQQQPEQDQRSEQPHPDSQLQQQGAQGDEAGGDDGRDAQSVPPPPPPSS